MSAAAENDESSVFRTMLSAQVRARLLFDREIALDNSDEQVYNERTLEGLIRQRDILEKQKLGTFRNVFLLVFTMYMVSNGQDLEIPWIGISLSEIPGLNSLLGLASAYGLFVLSFAMVSSGAYLGLIEQFTKKFAANGVLDPDILTASISTQQLFIKIFRVRFNTFQEIHIKPCLEGRIIYSLAIIFPMTVIILAFIAAYMFIAYFLVAHIPDGYFGIGSKALAFAMLFVSIFTHFASLIPLRQRWQLSELDTHTQRERR